MEAARLACAVAVGPHTGNFIDAVQVLDRAGALARVTDGPSIAAWVEQFWATPSDGPSAAFWLPQRLGVSLICRGKLLRSCLR